MVTGLVPSPPRFVPSIFIVHRVQQSHCSSIFIEWCYYNPSRPSWLLEGTLRHFLIVDPRECGYAHNPPRCVSTSILCRRETREETTVPQYCRKTMALRTFGVLCTSFFLFSSFRPIYYPRITLALPPSSNSDPGSHSGPSSPLPTTVRAFISIAKIIQRLLPSSTRVELFMDPRPLQKIKKSYLIPLP